MFTEMKYSLNIIVGKKMEGDGNRWTIPDFCDIQRI